MRERVIVKFFDDWKRGEPTLLFSVSEYSIVHFVKLIERVLADSKLLIDLCLQDDFRVHSARSIQISTSQTDRGLRIEGDLLVWAVSKEKWKQYHEMASSLAVSPKQQGHHYFESAVEPYDDITVEVALEELPLDWWGWRTNNDPWTFFGSWLSEDIAQIRALLEKDRIDFYTSKISNDEQGPNNDNRQNQNGLGPKQFEGLWIFDSHIANIPEPTRSKLEERKSVD